tara:strand:- start:54 stop:170 length:117 start_codon:yes stop_codon:yes gene_type:complete
MFIPQVAPSPMLGVESSCQEVLLIAGDSVFLNIEKSLN